ncbi:MAG: ABC transporter permease [Planctomycetota bacterium]|nr:ABC transporter permease [Planctomycetota bacterium]
MHETSVIFRRELKSYFLSPIAYVFGVLFLSVLLFLASGAQLIQGQQASMQTFFGLLPIVFLFFLPGLTMRLWAEERRSGTIELLMTFPVKISQLIAGKFLASLAFMALLLVLTVMLPWTLSVYGTLDWIPTLGAYFATLLLAGAYISVGMFWSSLTRDQIVAMLLSLVTLVLLYIMGFPPLIEQLAGVLPAVCIDVLNGISPYKYFQSISRGVFDTRDFIYYACFCGFFLHANALVLHARRLKG